MKIIKSRNQDQKNTFVKSLAISFLARREFTRSELEKKLSYYCRYDDQAQARITAILDELESIGYLSEERYINNAIRLYQKKYGTARVISLLRNQGISDRMLEIVRKKMHLTEFERADAVWKKKFGLFSKFIGNDFSTEENIQNNKLQVYKKQAEFLLRRGFDFEIVRCVLKKNLEFS